MFTQQFLLYSALYCLCALFVIVPPYELRAAGFSVEYLLGNYLGSEMRDFVGYQMRRTSLNTLIHCCLPIGYYFCGILCTDYFYKSLNPTAVYGWAVYVLLSLLVALYGVTYFVYCAIGNHAYHPLAVSLKKQASGVTSSSQTTISSSASSRQSTASASSTGITLSNHRRSTVNNTWTAVANAVNAEMLSQGDKFSCGPYNCRLFVTSNWLIQTALYSTNIVHKSDIHLVLAAKHELEFTTESRFTEEYVTIEVHSINRHVNPFNIRLRSQEYHELRERLSAPVVNARNIVLSQSINERFVTAFRSCVAENDKFISISSSGRQCETPVDQCIGCNVSLADVKLVKGCETRECGNCFCRPMWCVVCLSKWFAARQNQNTPQVWLEGSAPCPTCRAKFCISDVCFIDDPVTADTSS